MVGTFGKLLVGMVAASVGNLLHLLGDGVTGVLERVHDE